jgi:hypothetical protein
MNLTSIRQKVQKKHKYLFQSLVVTAFLFLFSAGKINFDLGYMIVFVVALVLFGTLISQYPNIDFKNVSYILLMPLSLIMGALLFLNYFPNLGFLFKALAIISFGVSYYFVSLVDNVFLVVQDREEIIPLYRVATAWSQIIQVIVAIPLFSGIFKLGINGIFQSIFVGIISFLYVVYQIWASRYDKDAKNTGVGETILLSTLGFFLVSSLSMAISFIPTEAFLRSLLISAVLMFVLSYTASYLRNDINRKMMVQFVFIFVIFLLLILFFAP